MSAERTQYPLGPYLLDTVDRSLRRDGTPVHVTPREYEILLFLLQRPGQVVSSADLISGVWRDVSVVENNVARQISNLKRKLGVGPDGLAYVRSVPGQGYFVVLSAESAATAPEEPTTATSRAPRRRTGLLWAAGAAILMTLIFSAYSFRRPAPPIDLRFVRVALTSDGFEKVNPVFVDGERVYFRERRSGELDWYSVPIAGGEPLRFPNPAPDTNILDIQSGGRMLFAGRGPRDREVWIKRDRSHQPEMMLRLDNKIDSAAFSPDLSLAAVGTAHDLVIAGVRDGRIYKRFVPPEGGGDPSWSPDGRWILVRGYNWEDSRDSLWLASLDEGSPSRVDSDAIPHGRKSFTPAGWLNPTTLILQVNRGVDATLWLLRIPRSSVWLSSPQAGAEQIPDCNSRSSLGYQGTIYAICESDRGELVWFDARSRQWLPVLGGLNAYEIDYSPDGNWMAYTRGTDSTVWLARRDGSGAVLISPPGVESHWARWAPDSFHIAFMGYESPARSRIYMTDRSGAVPEPLDLPGEQGAPNWSRDGRTLLWGDLRRGQPDSAMALHAMDVVSRHVREVPGSQGLWSPRWSRDGRHLLAFTPDFHRLMVADTPFRDLSAGLSFQKVADLPDILSAEWSRDSQSILILTRGREPHLNQILRLDAATTRIEDAADVKNFSPFGSSWVGSDEAGRILELRRTDGFEVFHFVARKDAGP